MRPAYRTTTPTRVLGQAARQQAFATQSRARAAGAWRSWDLFNGLLEFAMENRVPNPLDIDWPEHYAPHNSAVHVRNSLQIDAPSERVWAWLVRAQSWPDWYSNASRVRVLGDSGPDLALDSEFRWRTFGIGIRSRVQEFIPCSRIAWDGRAFGIDVYHAWVIEERGHSCSVVTEETQHGIIAQLGAWLMPRRMSLFHQIWLEGLAQKAVGGMPPGP
jgi:hypothetical protein